MLRIFKVKGESMHPVFRHGDYVLAFQWRNIQYRIGDVVLIRHPEFGMLIKRISQIREDHFLLEGDNSNFSLSPARIGWQPERRIIGKVQQNLSQRSKSVAKRAHSSNINNPYGKVNLTGE